MWDFDHVDHEGTYVPTQPIRYRDDSADIDGISETLVLEAVEEALGYRYGTVQLKVGAIWPRKSAFDSGSWSTQVSPGTSYRAKDNEAIIVSLSIVVETDCCIDSKLTKLANAAAAYDERALLSEKRRRVEFLRAENDENRRQLEAAEAEYAELAAELGEGAVK